MTEDLRKQQLLQRLDAIGDSLARTGHGLALLGLGSVGMELARLDAYSDLDFFVIVAPGYKMHFVTNLDWLSAAHPLVYTFKNTPDGYKVLFADGIYGEFAVFEPDELAHITFAPGRIVWQAAGFDATLCTPVARSAPAKPLDAAWAVGEALTCLYVGLTRYRRGEKLSAERFIQHYAVDRILELTPLVEPEQPALRDVFSNERRYEQRFPTNAALLPQFVQGYDRSIPSAKVILAFLEQHFAVNVAIKATILALCEE